LPIHGALPKEWRAKFEELKAEFPEEPEHPDYPVWYESHVGHEAPKSTDEIKGMAVTDLAEYLRSWQPDGGHFGVSREGLANSLQAAVSSEPGRYSAEAMRFREIEPIYVRTFLQGLSDSVRQGQVIEWEPTLELARWVVAQPRPYPEPATGPDDDNDPGWGWCRRTLTDIILNGLKENPAEIPLKLREAVWDVLEELAKDPDPSPGNEERHDRIVGDGANIAINTVRGRAIDAVLDYALWVRRHLAGQLGGEKLVNGGLGEMQEVREVLETHLDIASDPSLAVRSIYGMKFPWLVLLDPIWAKGNVARIFPSGGGTERNYRRAAWSAYIRYCRIYNNVFDILKSEYARAVAEIAETAEPESQDERLALHLMTLAWRGKLVLGPPDPLLQDFFDKAPDGLRAKAMAHVGRSLQRTSEPIKPEVLERIEALWTWRLRTAQESPSPEDHKREIAAFGWWFTSGKLDGDGWALAQLEEAIKLEGETDPDFMVVRRLAEVASDSPTQTVGCLAVLVNQAPRDKPLFGWLESARTILTTAHESEDTEAQRIAEETRNRLGERGHLDLRELW
jgi:hypothetical protein